MNGKNILLWCREPSWCQGLHPNLFSDAITLIPVFCFDPREKEFFNDNHQFSDFNTSLLDGVSRLRSELVSKGSNLLVSNGNYEKVIPSLARVLQANEVVTFHQGTHHSVLENLASFRADSINQVAFNLNMHSIGFRLEEQASFALPGNFNFPPFPKINPGRIPSAA
jgi:deoxyribodipyrimidine photolyase